MAERKLFNVKLSEEEIAIISERAEGKPISTYMRELALGQIPVASETEMVLQEAPKTETIWDRLIAAAYGDEELLWELMVKHFGTQSTKEMVKVMMLGGNQSSTTKKSPYSGWTYCGPGGMRPDAEGNEHEVVFLQKPKTLQPEMVRLDVAREFIEGLEEGDIIN